MRNNSYVPSQLRSTPHQREQIVAKYQGSGLTQREFAQRHGVKLGTFQQWIYRWRLPPTVARGKRPAFQEVPIGEVAFLNRWAAVLQLPHGVAWRLPFQNWLFMEVRRGRTFSRGSNDVSFWPAPHVRVPAASARSGHETHC